MKLIVFVVTLIMIGCQPQEKMERPDVNIDSLQNAQQNAMQENERLRLENDHLQAATKQNITPTGWKRYRGEWFEVKYPASFTVSSSGERDGVLFVAPDNSVQFYVYSPLWDGESKIYKITPGEVQVSESTDRSGNLFVTHVTYRDSNTGYMRSFENTANTLEGTRKIFGVFYSSSEAYSRYRNNYIKFKNFLIQYVD